MTFHLYVKSKHFISNSMESRYKVTRDIEFKVYRKTVTFNFFDKWMVFDISMFGIATFDCTCKSIDYPELGMVGIHYSSSLVWGTKSYNLFSEKLLKKTHKYVSISEYSIWWHMYTNSVYLNIKPITIQQHKTHSIQWNFVNFKDHLWTDFVYLKIKIILPVLCI